MATLFKVKRAAAVGTSAVQVGGYATANGTVDAVKDVNLVNRLTSSIVVSCWVQDAASTVYYKIRNTEIPPGESLQLVTTLMVMQPGDKLFVQADTAASLDVDMNFATLTQA